MAFINSHNRFYFLFLLFLLQINLVSAQEQPNKKERVALHLVSKSFEDSIVLRWVPVNSAVWEATRKEGFLIKRIQIIDAQKGILDTVATNLKPMTHEEIIKKYGESNKYVSIIDQTLYGEQFKYKKEAPVNFLDSAIQGQKLLDSRFFIAMFAASLSSEAAEAGALSYVDKNVEPGAQYIYILNSNVTMQQYIVDSGSAFAINVLLPEEPPVGLQGIGREKKIELHWDRNQKENFDAFDIERSDDGGKSYQQLNKIPYFSPYEVSNEAPEDSFSLGMNNLLSMYQIYIDSVPENYKEYYYRIRGYDGFGGKGNYSEPIITHAVDLTPPNAPFIDSIVNISPKSFQLYWQPNKEDKDIDGYFLLRSGSVTGEYKSLTNTKIDKNARSIIDSNAIQASSNFYILGVIDTSGNISQSEARMAVFVDSIPPGKPTGLEGRVDSLGIVYLTWDNNPEPDIKGYKVYFSYEPNGEFSQATQSALPGNYYQDTLSMKIINRDVYYKLAAIDYHSNASAFSEVIKLNKPILFAPTPAVAKKIYLQENKIITEWYASASQGVTSYEVFRRSEKEDWQSLRKISVPPHTDFSFIDTNFIYNIRYDYTVSAIDSAGLQSNLAIPVSIIYNKLALLKPVTDFTASLDLKQKGVLLNWKYDNNELYFYIIYRSENGGALTPYRSLNKSEKTFTDYKIEKGKSYSYAVQIKQEETQLESGLSVVKEVKYNGN